MKSMHTIVNWKLPIKTVSEANSVDHWTVKHKRHQFQKNYIKINFLKENIKVSLPCHIIITRISPRLLDDHDNLRMSVKWIVDALAENIVPGKAFGRADDCKSITWEYLQEKGKPKEYAVKIEIKS
jgi:hypothetical protein